MRYAGFWRRLGAAIVDWLVLIPIPLLSLWALASSRTVTLIMLLPLSVSSIAYHVVLHARFGQTLGKMATGVRVLRLSGEPIAWREAWLRSSVDIVFGVIGIVSYTITMTRFSDLAWSTTWTEKAKLLTLLQPVWARWTGYMAQAWIWSEVVTMLLNRQKRALHDYLAGTVVVHARK
jgi:uncharacterized RDD family membrane protein YckC